uniref:Probable ATP-dependent RNA helicase spindle-E n=1 Tax=Hemiscolopendra marginata TaxID=943146 RepID=A0A646QES9_9MYRI
MATPSDLKSNLMKDWFKLGKVIKKIEIEGSATGGLGVLPSEESKDDDTFKNQKSIKPESETDYVKQFLEQENRLYQNKTSSTDTVQASSNPDEKPLSQINEVEDLSTVGWLPTLNDLTDDLTQIYEHYDFSHQYNSRLLISKYKNDILNAIETQQVVIVEGCTGSGKTTQLPQYILDHCVQLNQHCNIIVTQPRRLAAVSIAKRVCSERGWDLGSLVGYQVGLDNKTSKDTRLSYVTTGVFLQKLIASKNMNDYTHVILDEVHERDQEMDLCLLVVRKYLRSVSRLVKVILMSAAFDVKMFCKYFATPLNGKLEEPIKVPLEGKSYPVSEHWINELSTLGPIPELDPLTPEIPQESYNLAFSLIKIFDKIEIQEQGTKIGGFAPSRGSVLVFLPGLEEISTLEKILMPEIIHHRWWIIPLHSLITVEEQSRVFEPTQPGDRKIILSTNIAESSVTVTDIKYIIDFCLTKNLFCDPETNYTSLHLEWASKANCKQRKGRAGRVSPGRVYRLITSYFYDNVLPEFIVPEMKRCPLEQVVLKVKMLDLGEPRALLALALDPPHLSEIKKAILSLKEVGALDLLSHGRLYPYDGDVTFIGKILSALPVDIHIGKLIALGFVFGCLEECIIIGAGLSLKSCFSKPFKDKLNAHKNKAAWSNGTFSDCIAILHAFTVWRNHKRKNTFKRPNGITEKSWCKKYFLQLNRLREMELLVTELTRRLERLNITPHHSHLINNEESKNILILQILVAGAFYPYYFIRSEPDEENIIRSLSGNNPFTTVMITNIPANQGILYSHDIESFFQGFGCKINLHFEQSKAFVEFTNKQLDEEEKDNEQGNENKAITITEQFRKVYLAVKMRQLQIPLHLRLYSKEELSQRMKQLELLAFKKSEEEHCLRTNRIVAVLHSPLKLVPLPTLQQTVICLFVTEVVECGHFWAHYGSNDTFKELKYLNHIINSDHSHLQPLEGSITPGSICLAPYAVGVCEYHRARIEAIRSNDVEVFFVDYGNVERVPKSSLRAIDKEKFPVLLSTPMQAFRCVLSEIKPSLNRCPLGTWTDEAKNVFIKLVGGKTLFARIYSVVQKVIHLELVYQDEHGRDTSINGLLKRQGFAEDSEEGFLSKQNHALREKYAYTQLHVPEIEEENEMCVLMEKSTITNLPHSNRIVKLYGPYSPLELQFYALTQAGRMRRVKVEPDSINSVVLDPEPQDKSARMISAAGVSSSADGMSIIARNTTLMPNIHGLPALVSLLFTPCAELRADPQYTRYTGVLCGLGYDPENSQSLYPEHDMEITFDTALDTDDLILINAIRMYIYLILKKPITEGLSPENLIIQMQNNARERLLKLLSIKRSSIKECAFKYSYKWRKVVQNRILKPHLKHEDPACEHTLHCGISLIDDGEDRNLSTEIKIEHIKELHGKASRSLQPEDILCELCKVTLTSPHQLLFHLKSSYHKELETRIFRALS